MTNFNEQETYGQIDSYLKETLSGDDLIAFQKKLDTDKAFRSEVEMHRDVHRFFQERERINTFRQKISEISHPERKQIVTIRFIGIAASILFLLGVSFWLYQSRSSADRLYTNNFRSPSYLLVSGPETERGTDNIQLRNSYQTAKDLFDKGAVEQALSSLKQIESEDAELSFHKGILYMHLMKWNEAILEFEISSSVRPEASSWYQGLSYIKLEAFDKTRNLFLPLTTYPNPFKDKAEVILKKLPSKSKL